MTMKSSPRTALVLAISAVLTACGGGGSLVRMDTPSPPPAPTSNPAGPCPSPVTADCVVVGTTDYVPLQMTGGRQSDHALLVKGNGGLELFNQPSTFGGPVADYRFSGGTTIDDSALTVTSNASLHSDVVVQTTGILNLDGAMTGNATNHGEMLLSQTVVGNVFNDGILTPASSITGEVLPARINGNFTQASTGTLDAVIGVNATAGTMTGGFISVTGRADIDGTLRLAAYSDFDGFGAYPLPTTPVTVQVLHADGGVFGQFANWTSPGLFITGSVRYLSNDVFFDASSISAAQAMATAHAGDALTQSTADHFDAAVRSAAGLAGLPHAALTTAQRQFLASTASIQRLQDYDTAVRTFDSLSGYGYVAATDALLQQNAMLPSGLIAHVGNLRAISASGAWAAQPAMLASAAGLISNEQRGGFDQWLSDRLLLGSSFGWSQGNLHFDRSGGSAQDWSPQWDVYLRRNGNADSYVLGDLGYGRHQLNLTRQIDLGSGPHDTRAQHNLDSMHMYVEAGRDFRAGQGWLTPFGAVSYAALRGAGFTELGNTGFEMIAQPSFQQRTTATAGLRFGRDWHWGHSRWAQLNLTAGYLQVVDARDDAHAAFTGAPDVRFALDGLPRQRGSGWLQMNLGGGGERLAWHLSYDRQASDKAMSLGMKLQF